MRRIERAAAFKRDYQRVKATPRYRHRLDALLRAAVSALAVDHALPDNHRDHALSGDWAGYRECHLKPDLLMIYRKPDADTLQLARLGSHSELFR